MNVERLGVVLVRLYCLHLLVEAGLLACTSLPLWWEQYHAMPNYGGHTFFMSCVRILLEAGAGGWLYLRAVDVVRTFTRDVPGNEQNNS